METTASIPDAGPQTPDPSLADWFTPRRFGVFLLVAFGFAFPGIWMGTETFFRSDYGVMAYPAAHYLRESIWAGELPLWNPLSNCGAPFLAQWGTMCLYPGSLFFVALPMPWSLGVFCLLHLWLGGMGARALAERWTGNRLAAAVAGTAFAINGASLACITWPNYCAALGWMPWIVLLTEQAWREGGRKLVLAALAGTMQMLTGVPELVILAWGLLGVMLVVELCGRLGEGGERVACCVLREEGRTRSDGGTQHGTRSTLVLRFLAIVLLIAVLSAAQLLPFFDLLAHSQRDASYSDARWPMPPWGWANFLVPLFRYGQTPQGFWTQVGQEFMSSYYLGLGVLALAVVAVWKVRERRVWLLAGATVFALVMALGDAGLLYTALKKLLPGGGIARFPVKFVLLAAFTVPMLAAFGIAWLMRPRPVGRDSVEPSIPPEAVRAQRASQAGATEADARSARLAPLEMGLDGVSPNRAEGDTTGRCSALLGVGLALVAGVAVILWIGQQHPLQYDRWPETRVNAGVRIAWLAAALGVMAVVAGFGARAARERLLVGGALLVLLAADPLTHQPNQVPRIPAAILSADSPFRYKNLRVPASDRLMISPAAEERLLHGQHVDYSKLTSSVTADPANLWALDYGGKLRSFWSHLNLLDGLAKVNGSSTLQIQHQAEVQKALYPTNLAPAPPAEALKDFLCVISELVTDEAGGISNRRGGTFHPRLNPWVRIGAKPVLLPRDELLKELVSTSFDPNKVVLFTFPEVSAGQMLAVATPRGRSQLMNFSKNELIIEVSTDVPAMMTLAQSYYHPWKAFVDGQPVKLWRANHAFQAVEVPAGKHTVRLAYVDERFRLGMGISLAGLVGCGWLWWRAGRVSKVQ